MADRPKPTPKVASASDIHRPSRIAWLADFAVVVSVILMGLIYYAQRRDAEEFMRRNTTVNLVSMRYSDRILSAEKNLNDYVVNNYDLYTRTEFAKSETERPEVRLTNGTRSDFMLIVDFYSDILACRKSRQCEPALVDQWFKDDICQFIKLGQIIGFPQLRQQYGDKVFERLDSFQASDCKAES